MPALSSVKGYERADLMRLRMKNAHYATCRPDANPLSVRFKEWFLQKSNIYAQLIFAFLDRKTISLMLAGLWDVVCSGGCAVGDTIIPDFLKLEEKLPEGRCRIEGPAPLLYYEYPVHRVALISYEIEHVVISKTEAVRTVTAVCEAITRKLTAVYNSLRCSSIRDDVMRGEGPDCGGPRRSSARHGDWLDDDTLTRVWRRQRQHIDFHKKYLKNWNFLIACCGSYDSRLGVVRSFIERKKFFEMLPHKMSRVARCAVEHAAVDATLVVYYTQKHEVAPGAPVRRYEGAQALQRYEGTALPFVFRGTGPCDECSTCDVWERIAGWRDANAVEWAKITELCEGGHFWHANGRTSEDRVLYYPGTKAPDSPRPDSDDSDDIAEMELAQAGVPDDYENHGCVPDATVCDSDGDIVYDTDHDFEDDAAFYQKLASGKNEDYAAVCETENTRVILCAPRAKRRIIVDDEPLEGECKATAIVVESDNEDEHTLPSRPIASRSAWDSTDDDENVTDEDESMRPIPSPSSWDGTKNNEDAPRLKSRVSRFIDSEALEGNETDYEGDASECEESDN